MALVVYDRVQQTGTANTTVSFTLSGSATGYQSFSVIGNGNTTFYGATDTSGNWEVGVGTYATGGTLTRTTILSSSNSGSAVTFSGAVTVFVTYPSEKSVNLDSSGNVSALGTITSGVWNGTTIPVAYGGTGVTASSGANSVVLRDSNQNVTANNFLAGYTVITAAGTTTVLTAASTYYQRISGSTTQTIQLPVATTLVQGQGFVFDNDSSGTVSIVDSASGAIDTVPSGGYSYIFAEDVSTSAGSWGKYALLPASYDFSTTSANFGGAVISNTTYQGTAVASGYGGTGLTTFAAANNALYSTSSSALAAGTLPIAAGGTGQTTAGAAFNALSPITTAGDLIIGNGTNSATRLGIGANTYVLTSNGATASWGAPAGSTTLTTTDFTATAGQTTFTVTYTPALLQGVYRNGVKLGLADYTATSGTSIVLATGAIVGDLIEVQYFSALATSTAVNSFSAGTTGLTPSSATTGAVTLAGTLNVANGGTGATTLTGVAYGNGTSAFTAATASQLTTAMGVASTSTNGYLSSTDWNTFNGKQAAGTYVTSVSGTAPVVSSGGTTPAISMAAANTTTSGYLTSTDWNTFNNKQAAGSYVTVGGALGTPSSGTLTNCTFPTLNQNTTGSAATFTSTTQNSQFNSIGVGTAGSGTAGEIRATNNITAFYSDERLKTKVGNIENALEKVKQIETMVYHANDIAVGLGYDASIIEVGVTAQSVQRVQPEVVVPAPIDDKYLTVRYEKLVPLLIEAIKELEAKVAVLEAR